MKNYDVIIVGGGPVGLCFAASVAKLGLQVVVIEQQSQENLALPAKDGRDIAITPLSKKILHELGVWQHIPMDMISIIKQAKVLNGASSHTLDFDAGAVGKEKLAYIVSNHLIRKAAFQNATQYSNISLITDVGAVDAYSTDKSAFLTLSNGRKLTGHLLVAADSRFSTIREKMGISSKINNFGKHIIVCQMEIERNHNHIAHECFYYGYTLATLPLCNNKCSVVLTVVPHKARLFMNMNTEEFNSKIEELSLFKYGKMKQIGERYLYPLVSVYANQFVGKCFALLGDAAVGMHPVTAHGFNFGIQGQNNLSNKIKMALKSNSFIGSQAMLVRYEREHRQLTKLLYITTNTIATLFTNDTLMIRGVRDVLLKVANHALPIKKLILSTLTEGGHQSDMF
ncbi:5-demethoxyubiquinol-8 5-hydroxylase UbiM [Legionella maioricensis]|uniref:5-demethoxyubiquinol-8 5-hydroxylase UbiM n=1 Tax=Legionella maioricensis TaxID=2896528 RepID=A0A9X2D2U1_9GAMM|nr:5-demethoxyubiquinol-8 5-hydroxylase UbiM [Legionella maioricensis]MCL9685289.1 5-demethoxyubiquinol-8 5-hydroxylase UbiM [Legionella maioricensis]MCL9688544.1 5-demethoxyubiquinol-8 5-hydroxylase UbiM [Legionella maioricensis]